MSEIITDKDCIGLLDDHPWSHSWKVLGYKEGGITLIPNHFFQNWQGQEFMPDLFHIGKCSGIGIGSIVRYDSNDQLFKIGRFVSGGSRLKFLLNAQHETRTISSYMFSNIGMGIHHLTPPKNDATILKNDIWIGDEAMFLGGCIIENGCIIGARSLVTQGFKTEAYGIYAGSPAKLKKFRFSEKIRELLLKSEWWEMPLSWVKENNNFFLVDLTADEGHSLELLNELIRNKLAQTQFTPTMIN